MLQFSVLTFSLFLGSITVGVEQRELTQSSRSPPGVTTSSLCLSSLLPREGRARARGLQGDRLPSRPGRDRRLQGEGLVGGGYFTRHSIPKVNFKKTEILT